MQSQCSQTDPSLSYEIGLFTGSKTVVQHPQSALFCDLQLDDRSISCQSSVVTPQTMDVKNTVKSYNLW